MINKLIIILLFLAFGLALNAQDQNQVKIKLLPGEVYKVELPHYKSADVQWIFEPTFDTSFLSFQGQEYVAPADTMNKKDSGKDTFTFKAIKKGEVKVLFALKPKYDRHIQRTENYLFIIGKN